MGHITFLVTFHKWAQNWSSWNSAYIFPGNDHERWTERNKTDDFCVHHAPVPHLVNAYVALYDFQIALQKLHSWACEVGDQRIPWLAVSCEQHDAQKS